MGLLKHLNAFLITTASYDLPYQTRLRPAGKPTGKGNETTPITHFKPKKKEFGERKLTKKQRKTLKMKRC